MADIGKSTTGHSRADTQAGRDIERLLTNWGNWLAFLPGHLPGEYAAQPMFKEYVAGYRVSSSRRLPESVDAAEALDQILSTLCERDVCCLICEYVLCMSSRNAAKLFCTVEQTTFDKDYRKGTLKCTYRTYQTWLATAVTNAELKTMYATGIELERQDSRKKPQLHKSA